MRTGFIINLLPVWSQFGVRDCPKITDLSLSKIVDSGLTPEQIQCSLDRQTDSFSPKRPVDSVRLLFYNTTQLLRQAITLSPSPRVASMHIPKIKQRKLLLFAALALVYCYVSFHRVTMAVIGDLLADEFRLDPARLGLLGGVLLYCYAFLQMPSGFFADNVGPKRTILLSLILSTIGSVVFAVSQNFAMAMTGRILIGAGISCIYLSLIKILSAWFDENEFGAVLGMLMALGMLGNMIAATPLAASVDFMGWRASYGLVAVLTLGLIALVYVRVKNTPDGGTPQDSLNGGPKQPELKESVWDKLRELIRTVSILMCNRSYLMLVVFMFAGSSQQGFQSLWAGPFLTRSYDYSLIEVGNALLWYSAGGICGAPVWGFLSDRLFKSRKKVLAWCSVVGILIWALPAFIPLAVPRSAVPVMLFIMGVTWGGGVLTHAMVRESFSFEILGVAVGVVNFFTFLGGAAFTQLMGNLVAWFPKNGETYPLLAYQATIMLVFGTWIVRLVSITLTEERKKPALEPAAGAADAAVWERFSSFAQNDKEQKSEDSSPYY
jgi:sugar phosphate permease